MIGDVCHYAHAVQIYKRRGYGITVQAEENKLFVWKVAGVNIVQGGNLPDHGYVYPSGFEDLSQADYDNNKVAFGLRHSVVPSLESLGLTPEQAWDELCGVRLDAMPFVSQEAHTEAEKFLEGMPRPIVCIHSRGTNWHERKSIPTEVAFETILKLIEKTVGSVIVLDFDHRAPMVGHARCKGIIPSWGMIDTERQCALFSRCDLMIGIDSGPFHLAAMTKVPCLGVFRDLHPNRVCLPNPNAVYLASDRFADEWQRPSRTDRWTIQTYPGREPSADDIAGSAIAILEGKIITMAKQPEMRSLLEELAGRYIYNRVSYDERQLELLADGTIGEGSGDCEQTWTVHKANELRTISISGKHGVICVLQESDGIFKGRWTKFERMLVELTAVNPPMPVDPICGKYFCELIGYWEFELTIEPDGKVDSPHFTSWAIDGDNLALAKGDEAAVLHRDPDGCWRGPKIELIPTSRQPFRSCGVTEPISYRKNEYLYITHEDFKNRCVSFARSLPPIRAIAGIPRSGLLAASLVATELNCPMIPLESLLTGQIPEIPLPRRGRETRFKSEGIILVVDDKASSGRTIARLREKLNPNVKIGVVIGSEHADFVGTSVPHDIHHSYEWTILHDDNAEFTLCDLDGVLCEDWTGGNETDNYGAYVDFLNNTKPRRIPSYELMGVVTNRLECHRDKTETWLKRHGVRYQRLIMSPHETHRDRDDARDSAIRKADAYRSLPECRLFIESESRQAKEIQRLTGRPVLSIEDNQLV